MVLTRVLGPKGDEHIWYYYLMIIIMILSYIILHSIYSCRHSIFYKQCVIYTVLFFNFQASKRVSVKKMTNIRHGGEKVLYLTDSKVNPIDIMDISTMFYILHTTWWLLLCWNIAVSAGYELKKYYKCFKKWGAFAAQDKISRPLNVIGFIRRSLNWQGNTQTTNENGK